MLKIQIKMEKGLALDDAAWTRVMPRFEEKAGKMLVEAVQSILGTDAAYTLNSKYADRKESGKTKPQMKRISGKGWGEPLILSGAMWAGMMAALQSDTVTVEVDPSVGLDKNGNDYAEEWEQKVEYLEKGLALVEEKLPEVLLDCIFEALNL